MDSLPAGLGGGSDPVGTAPSLASYEIPPSADEKKAQQESDTARTEAVTQYKKASKETGDYLAHLADAPNPKDFGLNREDLNALSPTKPPEYKSDNPIKDFGGMASLIGIFGGMMSRRPLVTSLNAATAAMTAYHQRNLEEYDQQVKEWKNNTDYISKVMDWREKAYDIADKQFSGNLAKWTAANTAIAAQSGDFDKIDDLEKGNADSFYQKRRDAQAVKMQWQQHLDAMNEFAIRQRELLANPANAEEKDAMAIADGEIKKKEADSGKPLSDAEKAQIRVDSRSKAKATGVKGSTPFAIAYQTEQARRQAAGEPPMTEQEIIDLKNSLNTPRSGTAIAVQRYMQEHKDDNGGKGPTSADVQKFLASGSALSAAQRSLSSGPMGLQLKSLGVATDHLTTLRDLVQAFNGGDVQVLAAAKAAWERQFGTPAPANQDLAAQFVAPELIKAIEGTPGGVAERDEMASAFKAARGYSNVMGAIDTAFALMGGQMNGMKNQIVKVNKMMTPEEFDDMIPSTALDAMQKHATKSFQPGGGMATLKATDKDAYAKLPKGAQYKVDGDPTTYVKQ